jgi:nitrite reductase (cytochrome c-552)
MSWNDERNRGNATIYVLLTAATAVMTIVVMLFLQNISDRKEEAKEVSFRLVELTEETIDPAIWGKNFPRQYDQYLRTVDTNRTKHGGSEAFQKLDDDPRWRTLFQGYAFSVDYREERGHAYMLSDQDMTERVKLFKQPGSCLHCHASVIDAYARGGRDAGAPADDRQAQVMKGFELVCPMPYEEARKLVEHPVTCVDCHDPDNLQLRVTRPGFIIGIQALAQSDDTVPHIPSIERWRKGKREKPYDPNVDATRQEMRSFVCGQCHVEYYFKGDQKLVTYPWHHGLKVGQIETYYDEVGHKDWLHAVSKAPVLKAQHPEFELWSQGIHARSGVACADCHMPYMRQGAIKISDHHVRSPMLNVNRACQSCHPYPEDEIRGRVEAIQDRTRDLMVRTEEATLSLIRYIEQAAQGGASDEQLVKARDFHRKAQWRLDFIAAENSMGFHASQESAKILGEAIDYARQGSEAVIPLLPRN